MKNTGADFEGYISLIEIRGITKKWIYQLKKFLRDYLIFVEGWIYFHNKKKKKK